MTAKADMRQFVRVEFARSLASIKAGAPRHPWHWCLLVQNGHIYAISTGFDTLAEAAADFAASGVQKAAEAEAVLAEMYRGPHDQPYDVAMVNEKEPAQP
jgi:hypothetical protein